MRRTFAALTSAVALVLTLAASATASSEIRLTGHARDTFGFGNSPSGVVKFIGLGHGTTSWTETGSDPVGPCFSLTFEATITLAAGSFDFTEVDLFCPAGGSGAVPGGVAGWGAPYAFSGTFTIHGGSGAYSNATGGGTISGHVAGNVGITHYDGAMLLP